MVLSLRSAIYTTPLFATCLPPQVVLLFGYIQVSGITNQNIMAKKVFLNRERATPTVVTPSVNRADIPSTSRSIPVSKQLPFRILDETSKSFPKFHATGRSLLIEFNSPSEEQNPATYLKECITALKNYLVDDMPGRDLFENPQ